MAAVAAAGIGDAPQDAAREALLRTIDRLVAETQLPAPETGSAAEQIEWMHERAVDFAELEATAEAFLEQYPDDPQAVSLKSVQMEACFDAATIRGEPLTVLSERASAYVAGEGDGEIAGDVATRDAEYWMLMRELQRLEALALRGQINTADRLAAMEDFAFRHTSSAVTVPIMAELIEGWTDLGDYVRADDWLAVLKEHHSSHVTTRAIEGRHLLQRAVGTTWRPDIADIMGRPIKWRQFDGSVTLVVFWSPSHRLSIQAIDFVRQLDRSLDDDELRVIGVSLDGDPARAFEATLSRSSDWTVVCDGRGWSGPLPQTYGIRSLPTMLLLDGQGILQRFWTPHGGACRPDQVEQEVRNLVDDWHSDRPISTRPAGGTAGTTAAADE